MELEAAAVQKSSYNMWGKRKQWGIKYIGESTHRSSDTLRSYCTSKLTCFKTTVLLDGIFWSWLESHGIVWCHETKCETQRDCTLSNHRPLLEVGWSECTLHLGGWWVWSCGIARVWWCEIVCKCGGFNLGAASCYDILACPLAEQPVLGGKGSFMQSRAPIKDPIRIWRKKK